MKQTLPEILNIDNVLLTPYLRERHMLVCHDIFNEYHHYFMHGVIMAVQLSRQYLSLASFYYPIYLLFFKHAL